jgi:hypothetical protein
VTDLSKLDVDVDVSEIEDSPEKTYLWSIPAAHLTDAFHEQFEQTVGRQTEAEHILAPADWTVEDVTAEHRSRRRGLE